MTKEELKHNFLKSVMELRNKDSIEQDSLLDVFEDIIEPYIAELEKENSASKQEWEVLKNTISDCEEFCNKYTDLVKENAELKEKLKPENCLKLLAKEGYIKFTSERLVTATKLLEEVKVYTENIDDEADALYDKIQQFLMEE